MIKKFEMEHGVVVRWTEEMDEYREAKRIATMGEQQKVKEEMLRVAKERCFTSRLLQSMLVSDAHIL